MTPQELEALWAEHTSDEFVTRDLDATLDTMVEDAYVNHIPTMTGGYGRPALRAFYGRDFIPCMLPHARLAHRRPRSAR